MTKVKIVSDAIDNIVIISNITSNNDYQYVIRHFCQFDQKNCK